MGAAAPESRRGPLVRGPRPRTGREPCRAIGPAGAPSPAVAGRVGGPTAISGRVGARSETGRMPQVMSRKNPDGSGRAHDRGGPGPRGSTAVPRPLRGTSRRAAEDR
ncbi:hypothetical protein GCM10009605_12780 [Nocardiopsis composta]